MCLALVLAGGGLVVNEYLQYKKGADSYAKIQLAVASGENADDGAATELPGGTVPIDFGALRAINSHVVGWLECKGTGINYPIVQGADNERYLDTLFDGTKGKAGCLFVDYENSGDFTDRNTVIYGHNLLDGSMLSSIVQYGHQAYFDAHPTMVLHTPRGSFTLELFAGYVAQPTNHALAPDSPWALEWEDDTAFIAWLEQAYSRSVFNSEVEVAPGDKMVTLSTCTNGGQDRFVLHCRLAAQS